jgi:CDP-glycerol glycerophosphotransferase (TagB/SpsB family)
MKFDRFNILHAFIYLYGSLIFNCIFLINKFSSKQVDKRVILYGHKLYGNLKSLYKELEETNLEFYFLTLDYRVYKKLRKNSVKVLYGLKISDIAKVISSKIIVTDHGLHFMKKLLHKDTNYFFDTTHGLPFQKWNEDLIKQWYDYQEVWLFSNYHKDIYIKDFGYKKDNLKVTGYGRLDYIKKFNISTNKIDDIEKIKNKYKLANAKKIVLYAPTWIHLESKVSKEFMRPDNLDFLKYLNNICKSNNLTMLFRPHLNTKLSKKFTKELDNLSNLLYFPFDQYEEVEEFLVISDILITDWSSIALDYILFDRPTIFLNLPNSFKLGIFKEEVLRFGKISDKTSLEKDIVNYIRDISLYIEECPQHSITKNTIYKGSPEIAAEKYITRIMKYV